MSGIIIVGCTKAKRAGGQAACVKYASRAHDAVRSFMIDGGWASGWDYAIVSAEFGLLRSTDTVPDYDTLLTEKAIPEIVAKSKVVANEINEMGKPILVYGGKVYAKAVQAMFPNRKVTRIVGADRGNGDHFSALIEGFDMYDADA